MGGTSCDRVCTEVSAFLFFERLISLDFNQRKNNKRKRKLLVDADKELSCHAIYHQLNNSVGTLVALDLAPPTKQTMMWKESGGVETLLSQPAQHLFHAELQTVKISSLLVCVPLCRWWDCCTSRREPPGVWLQATAGAKHCWKYCVTALFHWIPNDYLHTHR